MNWQTKAAIMRLASQTPYGDHWYRWVQKRFGRLSAKPMSRLPMQAEMLRWLLDQDFSVQGKTMFEVGTGHMPIVPIGFFLSGAKQVVTVDLNKRIDWGLTRDSIRWILAHRKEVEPLYAGVIPEQIVEDRFDVLARWSDKPKRFMDEAHICYLAPADASHVDLPDHSVDCHFSVTVLEHIPPNTLVNVFREALRIVKTDGYMLHLFDPSDHFQHQDKSISAINFLRYSEAEWDKIAGNEFAYCNRLRNSDYQKLFADLPFDIVRWETSVNPDALAHLNSGFTVDERFRTYSAEDLCATTVRIMLRHAK